MEIILYWILKKRKEKPKQVTERIKRKTKNMMVFEESSSKIHPTNVRRAKTKVTKIGADFSITKSTKTEISPFLSSPWK